jgi:hypothetical protein
MAAFPAGLRLLGESQEPANVKLTLNSGEVERSVNMAEQGRNHTVEVSFTGGTWLTMPVVFPGDTVFLRFKGPLPGTVQNVVVKPTGAPGAGAPAVTFVPDGEEFRGTIHPSFSGDSIELDILLSPTGSSSPGGGGICVKTQPPPRP